jgi:hypothetical protein
MVDEAKAATPDPRARRPARLRGRRGHRARAQVARPRRGDRSALLDRRGQQWQPTDALRARIDAVTGAPSTAWRTATRYGAAGPAADDALALWALTCIEPRTGGGDDDELQVPDALRAAVVAGPAPRDDEAVLARWAWLDREIPRCSVAADRSRPSASTGPAPPRRRVRRVHRGDEVLFMSLFWWAGPVMDAIDGR